MDERLKQAINEDSDLVQRGELLADLLQRANSEALMNAILANDEKGIARALDMSLEDARELAAYFHDKALNIAESHPQLREAARYFGSKK